MVVTKRKQLLRTALFSDGDSVGPMMAATMLFTLNGVPMLFNGEEQAKKSRLAPATVIDPENIFYTISDRSFYLYLVSSPNILYS